MYDEGWHIDIAAHLRRGGYVLGLCGGYQMLGHSLKDPNHIESNDREISGLGHLQIETELGESKTLARRTARVANRDITLSAYEMHMGQSEGRDTANPLFMIDDRPEGAVAQNGRVMGTYLHGLLKMMIFANIFWQI